MKKQTDAAALERYRQEHNRCLGIVARQLRDDRALTQEDVAKRANVSLRWLKRLEANELKTNYLLRRLDQVAGALGVELYEFYKRASEMTGPPPWLETEGTHEDE